MLRRRRISKLLSEIWMGGKEIEGDLRELVNMFGRNQLGCQDQHFAFGQIKGFARGGKSPRVSETEES